MNSIKFYKYSLVLRSRESRKNINFQERALEIREAKDIFNTKQKGKKFISILSLSPSSIELILKLESDNIGKIDTRSLTRFIHILQNDYNWKEFLDTSNNRLFEAKVIKWISQKQCKDMFDEACIRNSGICEADDGSTLFSHVESSNSNHSGHRGNEESILSFSTEDNPLEILSSQFTANSLEEALQKLEGIVGYEQFKNEISKVLGVRLISLETREEDIFPYHYLFLGEKGNSHYKAASVMAELFYHGGILKNRGITVINLGMEANSYSGINFEELIKENTGLVLVQNLFERRDAEVELKFVWNMILKKMQSLRGKVIFVLALCEDIDGKNNIKLVKETFEQAVNCRSIHFSAHTDVELLSMVKNSALKKEYHLNEEAAGRMVNRVKNELKSLEGELEYLIDKNLEKAILEKKLKILSSEINVPKLKDFSQEGYLKLVESDFDFLSEEEKLEITENNLLLELEKMIGLSDVKKRVKQIADFINVRVKKKELGYPTKLICMHMEFIGNPGTGKTTVARIMGKILKILGFLTKGHFVEVTRDNLVGQYIGQTGPKVSKIVESAKGGILFIDEAYSLNGHAENDYGNEVIASFVKAMEDYKDEMIFIYAGYKKEMDTMINMNPGMKDRIAFKIEFPDYNEKELFKIFEMMSENNNYKLTETASTELFKILTSIYKTKGENFGNGRIVRRIFERVEIIQNGRISKDALYDKDSIIQILEEDIKKLYEDSEIIDLIKGKNLRASIGFSA